MPRLTREEFHRWTEGQKGRFERIGGEPVAMSPELAMHVRLKTRIWAALDRGIRENGLDCEALGDGMTIEVDDDTDYEPDAVVNCGPSIHPDATVASNPIVVVEVMYPRYSIIWWSGHGSRRSSITNGGEKRLSLARSMSA